MEKKRSEKRETESFSRLDKLFRILNEFGTKYGGLLAIIGIVLSLLPYFIPSIILPTWVKIILVIVTVWGTYKLLEFSWDKIVSRAKPGIPQGQIFHGIFFHEGDTLSNVSNIFDRSQEIENLEQRTLDAESQDHILAVTGVSGVGKSVLVKILVEKLRHKDSNRYKVALARFNDPHKTDVNIIKELIGFVKQHENLLSQPNSTNGNPYVIVILDQFEICLDHIIDTYLNSQKSTKSLRDYLNDATNHSDRIVRDLCNLFLLKKEYDRLKIVVVVRSDRYYDLRILGQFGQIPYNAFEVLGIAEGAGTQTLLDALREINFSAKEAERLIQELKEQDGTILPVKVQIVGCMLERFVFYPKYNTARKIIKGKEKRLQHPRMELNLKDFKRLGGVAGLIEKYFRLVIQSSPNPDIAREILYVLGIEGRVKTRYYQTDLSSITFREENDLDEGLKHLSKGGLITKAHGQYALAHDYIAQNYNQLSGRLISPVVRDNLAYSHATFKEGKKKSFISEDESSSKDYTKYALLAVKLIMISFFGYRLLDFNSFPLQNSHNLIGLPFAPWFGLPFSKYQLLSTWFLDWQYLPLILAQCSWAFYVIELVNKIFVNIDDKLSMRLGSYTLVFMVIVGMIWTAFVPGVWLIWIGINGVCVGAKFSFLGNKIYKFTSGRNRYSVIGFYTIVNSLFVIYVGSVIYPYISWDLPIHQNTSLGDMISGFLSLSPKSDFLTVYYAIIPLMTYFIYMYRAHVRVNSSVEFIGLYKRVEAVYNQQ